MGGRRIRRKGRGVLITPEVREALESQRARFREQFGRDPGPDDPVFFDPTASEPKPLNLEQVQAEFTEAMAKPSIDPAIIYAYRHTGLIVTEENYHLLSEEDRREWNAALAEYEERLKGQPS